MICMIDCMIQDSDGGVLKILHGGSAVFQVPVEFDSNSVAKGYSGGALHVEGKVSASIIRGSTAVQAVPFDR